MKPCEDGHVVTTKVGIQFITELTDCNTGLFLGGGGGNHGFGQAYFLEKRGGPKVKENFMMVGGGSWCVLSRITLTTFHDCGTSK